MTLEADGLAERRRLTRRVRFWRIGAIILAVIAFFAAFASRDEEFLAQMALNPHIARFTIEGFISDDREQRKMLGEIAKNAQVRGVILYINSPGGTTAGAEALYTALRGLAEKKPIVAVFGTAATSAAYLAGISADHIVARGNSITGSVGVILQYAEVSELLNKLGVRVEEIRSGELKAVPSPFKPADPAGRALVEQLVNESREWFVNLVTKRRELKPDIVEQIKTGRIYTGRQALQAGLVDQIGDEDAAIAWLQEKRGVPKGLNVIDKKAERSFGAFAMHSAVRGASSLFGGIFETILPVFASAPRLNYLDGLISLWHPENQQ
jgi:protease-4